jgi:phosphatidylserine/phosphatidylglycerophosphate/cardiolipin synthase-like enzyme
LLWAGAPALVEPNTRTAEDARKTLLDVAPNVRCVLDRRAKFSHDHHQKAVTIDDRVAYVGGMDISTFQGDRWDTGDHPLRFGPGWHDVQVRIEVQVVADVEDTFCQR